MKAQVLKALAFLRLTDRDDGLVSLTNVACCVAIAKLALTPSPSVAELGALLTALIAYQYKGLRKDRREKEKAASEEVLAELRQGIAEAKDAASKALLNRARG